MRSKQFVSLLEFNPRRPWRSTQVMLIAVACIGLAACDGKHGDQKSQQERLVRVTHAYTSGSAMSEYTGTVQSRVETNLGFRVGGKIAIRGVDAGMVIHRGQPLMGLDPVNLALDATAAQQRLLAAQAEATRAAAEESRQKALLAEGAVSQTSYDAARAAREASSANRDAAEAAARNAQLQLNYASLTSDRDGVVLEVLAQPGQVVAAGTPIIRLAESGPREALVFVPETAIANLPREAEATLYGTDRKMPAKLREVSGAADPMTRTFAARYSLGAEAAQAPYGATITLTLHGASGAALQVPLAALHDGGKGMGVWVVTGASEVEFHPVTVIGLGQETATLAAGALKLDDMIVAMGAHLLHPGEKIRVLKDRT